MKNIYKTLLTALIITLCHTNLFSQFNILDGDGVPIDFIDDGSSSKNSSGDCFCNFLNDYNRLAAILGIMRDNEIAAFLNQQEGILKDEIESLMGRGFPSFSSAQHAFFAERLINNDGQIAANNFINEVSQSSNDLILQDRANQIEVNVLTRRNLEIILHINTLGALTHTRRNDQGVERLLTSMSTSDVQSEISFINTLSSQTNNEYQSVSRTLDGLYEVRDDKDIERLMADDLIAHYRNQGVRERIQLMAAYIIYERYNSPIVHWSSTFFSPTQELYRSRVMQLASQKGTSMNFSPLNMTNSEIINAYAITTFNDRVQNYGRSNVTAIGNYLQKNRYSSGSLSLADGLLTAHIDRKPMENSNLNFISNAAFPANDPRNLFDTGQGLFNRNILGSWNLTSPAIASGMDGFFDLAAYMRDRSLPLNLNTEGSLIRQALATTSRGVISLDSVRDDELARLFNLNTFEFSGHTYAQLVFDHNIGQILASNGYLASQFYRDGFALQSAVVLADGGEVDFNDSVILDSSFLTTKAYCVYSELKRTNGNLFRQTIGSFIDDPEYKLYFRVGNCTTTDTACTDGHTNIDHGIITIKIEDTNMGSLDAAANLLHEGIHAEIYRFVVKAHNGEVDPNDRARLFDLYKGYSGNPNFASSNAQHVYMAENYVEPIARAVRQLDDNRYPLEYYLSYGWQGLEEFGHESLLSDQQKEDYANFRVIVEQNTSFNPINCN